MVFGYFTKKYNEKLIESLPRSSSRVSLRSSLLESGLSYNPDRVTIRIELQSGSSYNPDRTRSVSVGIIGE